MTYRDDRDALRDQIRRLEQRLQDADHEVALLRGEAPSSAVDGVGALRALALDRTVAKPLCERRAADLERLWRGRLPTGMRVDRNGLRVTADSPGLSLVAEADANGGSRLRMTEDTRPFRRVWVLLAVSVTLTFASVVPLILNGSAAVAAFAAVAAIFALSAFPIGGLLAKRRRRELARIFEASAFVLAEDEPGRDRVRLSPGEDEVAGEALGLDVSDPTGDAENQPRARR